MSIVKKQHYVWRHYLRAWAEEESIWAFLKESNKVIKSNLMGVAQERYFYHLIDFTDEEEAFLKKYIEFSSGHLVKSLNLDFLSLFTSTGKLKRQLEALKPPSIDQQRIANEIRSLEVNLMEIAHGKMEALGTKLIACRSLEELKKLDEGENMFEAVMFLCFQYFRTKGMKNSVLKSFESDPQKIKELAIKSWNIISYISATNVTQNVVLDPKIRFILLENKTSVKFLTTDQPIINLLADDLDEQGDVAKLEFYYPISPEYSLKIHFNETQIEKYVNQIVDEEIVEVLNQKLLQQSDFYVFADNKEQLDQLIK